MRCSRVKTIPLLQTEQTDCGAVTLSIVMRYYGCHLSMQTLKNQCGRSRNGNSIKTLAQVATHYAMKAKINAHNSSKELLKAKFPLIIFWENKHFVILEGFKKNNAYINNPNTGRCKITIDELNRSFSGVSLLLEPTKHFKKSRLETTCLTYCVQIFKSNQYKLLFLIAATLCLSLPNLMIPFFSRFYIDQYKSLGQINSPHSIFLILLLMLYFQFSLTCIQRKMLRSLECKMATGQTFKLMNVIISMPIDFFTHRKAGALTQCLQSSDRFIEGLIGPILSALTNAIQIILCVSFMLWYSLWLGELVCAMGLINILCFYFTKEARVNASSQAKQTLSHLTSTTLNYLAMMIQLKSINRQSTPFSQWQHQLANYLHPYRKLSFLNGLLNTITTLVLTTTNIALLIMGVLEINNNRLSIGDFVAFNSALLTFNVLLLQLVHLASQFHTLQVDYDKMSDVLNQVPTLDIPSQTNTCKNIPILYASPTCKGKIELVNLTFGYSQREKPILNNVSMVIEPGSRVALIGASGSGKSTLAKLISGLYQPWSGQVLIDGVCLSTFSAAERVRLIGLVNQEQFFFKGTLGDNLKLWTPSFTHDEYMHATQIACIDDLLQNDDGLDYQLMEGASNLSGGQRQRLEIARTLLTNPSVLILDEATNSLDTLIEYEINKKIRATNKTLIMIAHRFNSIIDADIIYIIDKGQIIDFGSHRSLLNKKNLTYIEFLKKSG